MTGRRIVALNRALWFAGAGLLAAGVLLSGYWFLQRWISAPKPLQLPAIEGLAQPAPAVAALPRRNPFDPSGAAWQAAAAPGAGNKQVADLRDVRGVLASNIVSGVFTANGLIRTGEPFGGGTLEKVSREELVLRMPDGTTKSLQLAQKNPDDKVRDRLLELFEEPRRR